MVYSETEFAPWDGRRVPVTLVGGYLGAGKTTIINELLARTTQPIAVLVNDVGEINIDAALIARHSGDAIELTDGCICCSLSEGIAEAFDGLRRREIPPEHVLVELSGVADPHRVVPWALTAGFRLDSIVVVIDADQMLDRESEEWSRDAVHHQIAAADVLLLNKTALAGDELVERVRSRLDELAPATPIHDAGSIMSAAGFLGLGTRQPDGAVALPEQELFDTHLVETVPIDGPLDAHELDLLLDALPPNVLRAKAIIEAPDGARVLVQIVGKRRSVTALPMAEDEPATDLVVIRGV